MEKTHKALTDLQLARAALGILQHGHWEQGSNAFNALGLPVPPQSDDARMWCLRGACIKALDPSHSVLITDLHNENSALSLMIARAMGFNDSRTLVQWNDTQGRTETDVINRLKSLIQTYEERDGKGMGQNDIGRKDRIARHPSNRVGPRTDPTRHRTHSTSE